MDNLLAQPLDNSAAAAARSSPTSVTPICDDDNDAAFKHTRPRTSIPRPAPIAKPSTRDNNDSSPPHSALREHQFARAHDDRPVPDRYPPHSFIGMQCGPEANDDASRNRHHTIKRSIPSPVDTKNWRPNLTSLEEDQCDVSSLDPSAIVRVSSNDNQFGRLSQVMPSLAGQPVPGSCGSLLVNDPAGNSRASSSSFSSTSFSSSVTSTSSLSDTDKHFLLPPDDHTNCEQLEHAIHAEALSPPPPEMPSFLPDNLPGIVPMPSNLAQQSTPNALGTNKSPSSPDSAQALALTEESQRSNSRPSSLRPRPVQPVSASEFSDALHSFKALKLSQLSDSEVHDQVRHLLDLLDVLTDKMPLPVNERLFTALAEPKILMALVGLMQDVSVPSAPRPTFEALKQFRYPYVVGNILAGPKLADACLAYPALLDKILDILDTPQGKPQAHPVVVAHTINVLVTYLEYSPEPLLDRLEARPTFLSAIVRQLHLGSVVELISSLLPSRCVDAVGNMDPAAATFDPALEMALQVLAKAQCFHLFATAFSEAADRAVEAHSASILMSEDLKRSATPDSSSDNISVPVSCSSTGKARKKALYNAEQIAYNSAESYKSIIELTVRVVRIDTRSLACIYLHAFDNPSTTKTLGQILDAGIHVYAKTQGTVVSFLVTSMNLATEMLKAAESDSVRRVASVAGQPPPLPVDAITKEIMSRLVPLTLIATGRFLDEKTVTVSPRIRMHVLEFMATCQRVCSPEIFRMLDHLRFGEVAFKMLLLHQQHSMIHSTVVRAVESALLSDSASFASRRHWLVNSRLTEKVIRTWRKEHGSERWGKPKDVQRSPFLSAIVHIACCVQHWIACCHANSAPGERGIARELIGDSLMDSFNRFFADNLQGIVMDEKRPLGGERPSRLSGRNGGFRGSLGMQGSSLGSLRRSGSVTDEGSNPWSLSRNGVHLVRSISAHRFGFTEPAAPRARSHFADIFDCNDGLDDDNGNDFGLALLDTVAFIRAASDARQNADGQSGSGSNGGGLRTSISQSSLVRSNAGETLDTGGPDPFD